MTHQQAAVVDQPVVIYGERGAAAEAELKPPSPSLMRPAVTPIREWASKRSYSFNIWS
jgi:hypothetical protein